MDEIHIRWLKKAYELSYTQELYMPCANIKEQKKLVQELVKEHIKVRDADSTGTPNISITGVFRDAKQWIRFKRVDITIHTAYIKDLKTGLVEKVSMEEHDERFRRLTLMKEDGYSLEAVVEMEEVPLTPEEEDIWKQ